MITHARSRLAATALAQAKASPIPARRYAEAQKFADEEASWNPIACPAFQRPRLRPAAFSPTIPAT